MTASGRWDQLTFTEENMSGEHEEAPMDPKQITDEHKMSVYKKCHRRCPFGPSLALLFSVLGLLVVWSQIDNMVAGLNTLGVAAQSFKHEIELLIFIVFVVNIVNWFVEFTTTEYFAERFCHKSENCCVKCLQCVFGQGVQVFFWICSAITIFMSFTLCVLMGGLEVISGMVDASCTSDPIVTTATVNGADVEVTLDGSNIISSMIENAKSTLPDFMAEFTEQTTGLILCGKDNTFDYYEKHPEAAYSPADFMSATHKSVAGATLMLIGQILFLVFISVSLNDLSWEQSHNEKQDRLQQNRKSNNLEEGETANLHV